MDEFYGFGECDPTVDCEIIESNRNGKKLLHNGFAYHKDRQTKTKIFWVCERRRNKDEAKYCKAKARTAMEAGKCIVVTTTKHNHLPNALVNETHKFRAAIKRKSREGNEKPEKISRLCAAEAPVEVQTVVSKTAQRRMCQRSRGTAAILEDPDDWENLDPSFTQTADKKQYLLKNVPFEDGRILVFGSVQSLTRLSQSEVMICDGTFTTAPSGFKQVFTIHGSLGHRTERKFLPFVHILLPNKKETTYKKALKLVKRAAEEKGICLDPTIVLTDFENAEISAIRSVFPDSSQHGCFFHLVKSWWRRVQKLGLASQYSKSIKVQMTFRQAEALAFLRPQQIPEGLRAIQNAAPPSMIPFLEYLEKVYFLGKQRTVNDNVKRRSKPRYDPSFWSMREFTLKDLPRTSNSLEGWHNKFNGLFQESTNIKFYSVVQAFKEEERNSEAEYLRFLQGDAIARKKTKKEISKEKRLKTAITSYDHNDIQLFDHIQIIALILQNK